MRARASATAGLLLLGCGHGLPPDLSSNYDDDTTTSLADVGVGEDGVDPTPAELVQLVTGESHVCGLWTEIGVYCWGGGWLAQLGNGGFEDASTPQAVLGLGLDVRSLGAGKFHSCAVLEDGTVRCWGHGVIGSLGNGSEADATEASAVVGLLGPVSDVHGGSAHLHSCVRLEDGRMMCWGDNVYGQLGDGSTDIGETAQLVMGLTDVRDFAIGYIHTCAVDWGGQVSCWGWNPHGLIDTTLPTDAPFLTPWPKLGLNDVVAVSAGNHHACALHEDGHVSCWGYEGQGQLGDGSGVEHGEPLPVAGLDDVVALGGGTNHECALRSDGTIACWGSNYDGQLGDGTTTNRATPVDVVGIDDAISVTAGAAFTCAISSSRGPLCWGRNGNGQLGDGSNEGSLEPVGVLPPS